MPKTLAQRRTRAELALLVAEWRKRALRAESRERKLRTRVDHLVAANQRLTNELRERGIR